MGSRWWVVGRRFYFPTTHHPKPNTYSRAFGWVNAETAGAIASVTD